MRWLDICVIMITELGASFLLGRLFIPYLRRAKTGKFDWYLGDRFRTDGSEPKMGGAVMAAAFLLGMLPLIAGLHSKEGFSSELKAAIACAVYSLLIFSIGAAEDFFKDFRGKRVVLGFGKKLAAEFLFSLLLLIYLRLRTGADALVLLPFRLGYIDFSVAYYPLTALAMTLCINAFKLHDCFNGNTDDSIGGLCACSAAVGMMFAAVCSNVLGKSSAACFCSCAAAACVGILIWSLYPSKLYIGESGAMLSGAFICAAPLVIGQELLLCMLALPAIIDFFCAAAHYLLYKRTKKLLLQGAGLHAHLSAKGWRPYSILLLSIAASAVGGAAAVGFAVYSGKL